MILPRKRSSSVSRNNNRSGRLLSGWFLLLCWLLTLAAPAVTKAENVSEQPQQQQCQDAGDGACAAPKEGESTTTIPSTKPPPLECGLWLAPSTLEGAGLGMFAGRAFANGELLQEAGDVVIPITDLLQHRYDDPSGWTFLFDEYTWNAHALHMGQLGYYEVNVVSPGFGAAANSFLPLVNVDEGYATGPDAAGLHRSRDPGAGAFSYFHNRTSTAKGDIRAGQELFVDYGSNWFETRPKLGPIPLYEDIVLADKLFRKAQQVSKTLDGLQFAGDPREIMHQAWDNFVKNNSWAETSRVLGAFHFEDDAERDLLEEQTLEELRIEQSIRDEAWLQEHGTCGDHIVAGRSTIPQAGRGAFASRDLPAGTLVAHLPLVHIPERKRMEMYNLEMDPKHVDYHHPDMAYGVMGQQLILNYCMGHRDSTLLLCPYGPISSLINHGSDPSRSQGGNTKNANVKLQWGDPARGNHMPALLFKTIEAMDSDATAKLAMDVVATRDIAKGEEILLDYGKEWEQAWQVHVDSWKAVQGANAYRSEEQVNQETTTSRMRSVFEQFDEPYPDNVVLNCDNSFRNTNWKKDYYDGTLDDFIVDSEGELVECDVLRYHDFGNGTVFYTAAVHVDDEEEHDYPGYLLEDVPRPAFRFRDTPYSNDAYLPNAFRHDIRIPDDMFPEAWRNLRLQTDDKKKKDI